MAQETPTSEPVILPADVGREQPPVQFLMPRVIQAMTDMRHRQPDYVRAGLVWIFPAFVIIATKILGAPVVEFWPSFWVGVLLLALFELVAFASWGFWTGRLR